MQSSYCLVFFVFFFNFLGCTTGHVGSWFPNQGLNLHPLLGRQNLNWASREVPCSPHTVIFLGGERGAVIGFCCCTDFALVAENGGYSLAAALRLLLGVASLIAEHRVQGPGASVVVAPTLSSTGSVVVAHRLLLHGMWDLPGSGLLH